MYFIPAAGAEGRRRASGGRRGDGADLLHDPEHVLLDPPLDDLAVAEPVLGDARVLDPLPGRGDALELARVRRAHAPPRRDHVAFADEELDLRLEVREDGVEPLDRILVAVRPVRRLRQHRVVEDEVRREQLARGLEVALVQHLVDEAADDRLVLRHAHQLVSCRTKPAASQLIQYSTTLPSRMRQTSWPSMVTRRPVGAMPMIGPWCVPTPDQRVKTMSPSAIWSWTADCMSGKASRNIA